ncbi:MAG: hypothetical protein WD602_10860 [Actinomycetota bacterium]
MDRIRVTPSNYAGRIAALTKFGSWKQSAAVALAITTAVALGGLYWTVPLFATGAGNPDCGDLSFLVKYEWNASAYVVDQPEESDGEGVAITGNAQSFDWTSQTPIDLVIVKGGSDDNRDYLYDEAVSGSGLQGLLNDLSPDPDDTFDVSNVTFCYDDEPVVTVIKQVVNDNGGSAVAGDFTINVSGTGATPSSFAGNSTGTMVTLTAGGYSVTEVPDPDYTVAYSADCTGTIANGQTKVCTVTNDDAPPGLTVIKTVVNDNGGSAVAGDFTINVSGEAAAPSSFAGSESGTEVAIEAGSYNVTETAVDGYAASYSEDCSGSIALGEAKVCTITNDDVQPVITVIKTVVNDNGGTAVAGDFTINVSGGAATPSSFAGSGSGTEVALSAGGYSVTEDAVDGYAGTFSEDCSGVLSLGDEVTCTVTNIDLPPGLTVIKNVVNDNGGTAVAGDFEISVSTAGVDPEPFAGSSTGTVLSIDAGEYSVTEQSVAGYEGTFSEDCSGSIALGEAKACTVTNDDIPAEVGGVTLEKAPAEVAGVALENPKSVEVLGIQLPRTGVNVAAGLLTAMLLLAVGYGLMLVDRRTKGDPS